MLIQTSADKGAMKENKLGAFGSGRLKRMLIPSTRNGFDRSMTLDRAKLMVIGAKAKSARLKRYRRAFSYKNWLQKLSAERLKNKKSSITPSINSRTIPFHSPFSFEAPAVENDTEKRLWDS